MGQIWDFLIVQPIAFLLRSLYYMTHNYGVAILLFGVVAKLALLWFAYKAKRGMLQQQRLQPKIKELQQKYGKDRAKMQQEQQKLYQSEGVSMFGGCIWMFIPFPIIIALYGAVRQPLKYIMQLSQEAIQKVSEVLNIEAAGGFYQELQIAEMLNDQATQMRLETFDLAPELLETLRSPINFNFLGINLAEVPSFTWAIVLIPLISASTSFLSVWLTQKFSGRAAAGGNSQMIMYLIGPGISLWLGFTLPAALGVYWIAQNLLGIPQEYYLTKHFNKVLDAEEAAKTAREERAKAAEAAQKEEDRQRRSERIAAKNQKHKPKRYKLQNKPPASKEEQEEE